MVRRSTPGGRNLLCLMRLPRGVDLGCQTAFHRVGDNYGMWSRAPQGPMGPMGI